MQRSSIAAILLMKGFILMIIYKIIREGLYWIVFVVRYGTNPKTLVIAIKHPAASWIWYHDRTNHVLPFIYGDSRFRRSDITDWFSHQILPVPSIVDCCIAGECNIRQSEKGVIQEWSDAWLPRKRRGEQCVPTTRCRYCNRMLPARWGRCRRGRFSWQSYYYNV